VVFAPGLDTDLAGLAVALDDVHEAPLCRQELLEDQPVLRLALAVDHPAALAALPDERRVDARPGAGTKMIAVALTSMESSTVLWNMRPWAGLYWNPVLANTSFTSTIMVMRERRLMVCSGARRPMAIAPPSPATGNTRRGSSTRRSP